MRVRFATLLVFAGLTACKETPPPEKSADVVLAPRDTAHFSAPLLRRLAEAADGYRDGVDHFVVVSLEAPHTVAEVVDTRERAESIATARSTESTRYEAFGPYRTEPDSLAQAAPVDSVVAYLRGGTRKRYDGTEVDALFWSLPAYDKFVAHFV
jgi:hypothetical protein